MVSGVPEVPRHIAECWLNVKCQTVSGFFGHGNRIKSGLIGNMHRETPKPRLTPRSINPWAGDNLDIYSQSDFPKKYGRWKPRIELETTRTQTNRCRLQGHLDTLSSGVVLNLDSNLNRHEMNAKFSPKFVRNS
jgi:hypothetical protein